MPAFLLRIGERRHAFAITSVCPGNMTISVGHGVGTPSVTPGTVGFPSIAGLPPIITLVEIEAPGTGRHVAVVHGLLAVVGGTGHAVGLPEMSPAHKAGAPPTRTFVCFGSTVTGPE
jgi:hypothetical protein